MRTNTLSALEQEVMEIIWNHNKYSIRQVLELMQKNKNTLTQLLEQFCIGYIKKVF